MKKLTRNIVLAGFFLAASQAQALVITSTGASIGSPSQPTYQAAITDADIGQAFTLYWNVPAGTVGDSALPVDLTAKITFTINAFSVDYGMNDDTLSLGIDISNTTDLSAYPNANAAIVSFGFGVSPNATATLDTSGSVFTQIGTGSGPNQTFPGRV